MTTKSSSRLAIGIVVLLLCGIFALPSTVFAKGDPQPYKIKGTLYLTPTDPVNHPGLFDMVDIGEATYLGRYLNIGWLQFNAELIILAGSGVAYAANGDPSNWDMEPNTGRVLFMGADEGHFAGVSGYFDSTIVSMTFNPDGTITAVYTGKGEMTFPKKDK